MAVVVVVAPNPVLPNADVPKPPNPDDAVVVVAGLVKENPVDPVAAVVVAVPNPKPVPEKQLKLRNRYESQQG